MYSYSKLILILFLALSLPMAPSANGQATVETIRPASPWASGLIDSARSQIGVTLFYDGSYQRLDFPNGDIPRLRGVCTDVVIRALRDAHGIDLQALVNRDMKAAFSAYPKIWGLSGTDRNIDHRRVPNLQVFLKRHGASLPISQAPSDYIPGDVVTWMLRPGTPHIGIVSNHSDPGTTNPLIIHNIGWGTRMNDILFEYEITGHYRPEAARF